MNNKTLCIQKYMHKPKHSNKKHRRKTLQQRSSSLFHLQQSQEATMAKNDLLYHTEHNYSNTSMNVLKNKQFNQTFQSWHVDPLSTKNLQKPVQKQTDRYQELAKPRSLTKMSRDRIKSANYRTSSSFMLNTANKHLRNKTCYQTNDRDTSIIARHTPQLIPNPNSNKNQNIQHRNHMHSFDKLLNKTTMNLRNNYLNKNYQPQAKNKFIQLPNTAVDKVKINKGFLGTTFKQRHHKKVNWINLHRECSNNLRIQQFNTTNLHIKKQMDKIISLLYQQNSVQRNN